VYPGVRIHENAVARRASLTDDQPRRLRAGRPLKKEDVSSRDLYGIDAFDILQSLLQLASPQFSIGKSG
jgi:hypothetical protein